MCSLITSRTSCSRSSREVAEKAAELGVTDDELRLLRVLTPLAKLTTARQSVAAASEVVEAFGGAGYVEDTGIPTLLRDAQVLSIWEGTTNVLSLDTLRALESAGGMTTVRAELERCAAQVADPALVPVVRAAAQAVERAETWLEDAMRAGRAEAEAGARRFALTLGRALEAALLASHAQWEAGRGEQDAGRTARRLAMNGIDLVHRPLPDTSDTREAQAGFA